MGFLTPDIPEAEIQPEPDDVDGPDQRRELAIQRARRRSRMTSRENLIVNPSVRKDDDGGLAIRR